MVRYPLLRNLASLLVVGSGVAQAGVVTGQLVDSNGNPVVNAIFEVQASSGGDLPSVAGGYTDANGMFTATITPDGVYDITVLPLPAPQSLVVPRILHNVNVGASTNNLGVQTLQLGAMLTGQVVNVSGTPLQSVDLHFVAAPDYQPISFRNNETDSSGHYSMVVPFGYCEVLYKPGPVPYYGGPDTAACKRSYSILGSAPSGDTVMPTGYPLYGAVVDEDGAPIDDVEVRVVDTTSGEVLYTPDNTTELSGWFLLTLPEGTYDLHMVPKSNSNLAPKVLHGYSVPPGQTLPTTQLDPSVELRGRIRGVSGTSCVGATVKLVDSMTQLPVSVTGNQTDASGHYRMQVPTGVFDLVVSADYAQGFGQTIITGVNIDDDFDQDATLPAVPFYTTEGTGVAGSGGIEPTLSAIGGTPRLGNLGFAIEVRQGLGGSFAVLSLEMAQAPASGNLLVDANSQALRLMVLGGTPGAAGTGMATWPMPIANLATLQGQEIRARILVRDSAAPRGVASTKLLRATIEL